MNLNTIEKLLEKHFGPVKRTLTLGDESGAEEGTYYYTLWNEAQIREILSLLSLHKSAADRGGLPELSQTLPVDVNAKEETSECVSVHKMDEHWVVSFYTIVGVKYHSTENGGVAATLQLSRSPAVELSNYEQEDAFFGYWRKIHTRKRAACLNRDGFTYWMNKALWNNLRFREFTVDFFLEAGETEKKYILKDVARSIGQCGFFLPEVSYPTLLRYRTPAELIHSFMTEPIDIRVDFNKIEINAAYIMLSLASKIDGRDLQSLFHGAPGDLTDLVNLKVFFEGPDPVKLLRNHYLKTLRRGPGDRLTETYIDDYMQMSGEIGEPLRFGISRAGLIRAHDDLAAQQEKKGHREDFHKPLVVDPSRFDELEKDIKGVDTGGEFERIRTTERLFDEGFYQHNCVYSRRDLIRKDRKSVFHWSHKDRSYTVQFAVNSKNAYYVDEIRARFNNSITGEDFTDLKAALKGIALVPDSILAEYPRADGQLALDFDGNDEVLPF